MIEKSLESAFSFHQQGDFETANELYRQLVLQFPEHPTLNYLLGTLQYQIGDQENAEFFLRKAINLDPKNAQAIANLSIVLQDNGLLKEALKFNEQALQLDPNNPETYNNRAALFYSLENYDESLICAQRALNSNPQHIGALNNLGLAFQGLKKYEEAEQSFKKVLDIDSNNIDGLSNLGALLSETAQYKEALPVLKKAVSLDADLFEANINLGKILLKLHLSSEAEIYFRKVLSIQPNHSLALQSLTEILRLDGRFAEAAVLAIQLRNHTNEIVNGKVLFALSLLGAHLITAFDESIRELAYDKSEEAIRKFPYVELHAKLVDPKGLLEAATAAVKVAPQDANFHWYLAVAHLLCGEFIEGFKEYDWRFDHGRPMGHHGFDKPEWDGGTLVQEKLLVHGEQGFGDLIQFIRYLPDVEKRCKHIVFLDSGKAIYDLLSARDEDFSDGEEVSEVVQEEVIKLDYDYQIPLLSLPKVFGTTVETVPWDGSYLHPLPSRIVKWEKIIGNAQAIKIGIVWAGNPDHKNDHNRSCRLSDFAPLAKIPGIQWFVLQKGKPVNQAKSPPNNMNLIILDEEIEDFSDTMASITQLDLVISVDTSVIHLAGAMGANVWALLAQVPDWRWMMDREDSPWYPTMRLFRQTSHSNWPSVFHKVENALIGYLGERIDRLSFIDQQRFFSYKQFMQGSSAEAYETFGHILAQIDTLSSAAIEQYVDLAIKTGHLVEAETVLRSSKTSNALQGLAKLQAHTNDYSKAFESWNKSISLDKNNMLSYIEMGEAYFNQRRFKESVDVFEAALKQWPQSAELNAHYARALQNISDIERALKFYSIALEIDPGHPRALNNKAFILISRNELHDAILLLQRLLMCRPEDARAWGNLGQAYGLQKEHELARIFYARSIEIDPILPHLHIGYAAAMLALGKFDEALLACEKSIALAPNRSDGIALLGKVFWAKGDYESAADVSIKAIQLDFNNVGSHFILSLCQLMWGDYRNGWQEYEWRPRDPNDLGEKFVIPKWDGSSLNGRRLLIHTEQGFGDSIQFLRFLELLKNENITLHCRNGLANLFALNTLEFKFPIYDQDNFPAEKQHDYDVHYPLMSLPFLFGIHEENRMMLDKPLFTIDEDHLNKWKGLLDATDVFKIGIVWAGSTINLTDKIRSVKPENFQKLSKLENVRLYSLQKSDNDKALDDSFFIDLSPSLIDFVDTAAAIQKLDLIITVDTAVAHLAGSLHKPVWTILATKPDWRWQLSRKDTFWYPTMKLFRQSKPDDWSEVFERLAHELSDFLTAKP